jgi:5-methylcytosine-specific restriction endonuclease McrA
MARGLAPGPGSSLRGAPARPPCAAVALCPALSRPRRGRPGAASACPLAAWCARPLPLSRRGVAPLRNVAPAWRGLGSRGRGAPVWRGPLPVARPWRAHDSFVARQRDLARACLRGARSALARLAVPSARCVASCRNHDVPVYPLYFMHVDHIIYINEMATLLRNRSR